MCGVWQLHLVDHDSFLKLASITVKRDNFGFCCVLSHPSQTALNQRPSLGKHWGEHKDSHYEIYSKTRHRERPEESDKQFIFLIFVRLLSTMKSVVALYRGTPSKSFGRRNEFLIVIVISLTLWNLLSLLSLWSSLSSASSGLPIFISISISIPREFLTHKKYVKLIFHLLSTSLLVCWLLGFKATETFVWWRKERCWQTIKMHRMAGTCSQQQRSMSSINFSRVSCFAPTHDATIQWNFLGPSNYRRRQWQRFRAERLFFLLLQDTMSRNAQFAVNMRRWTSSI